jgi:hypothetical protein
MSLDTRPFDQAASLDSNVARAARLAEASATGNATCIDDALRVIARSGDVNRAALDPHT